MPVAGAAKERQKLSQNLERRDQRPGLVHVERREGLKAKIHGLALLRRRGGRTRRRNYTSAAWRSDKRAAWLSAPPKATGEILTC